MKTANRRSLFATCLLFVATAIAVSVYPLAKHSWASVDPRTSQTSLPTTPAIPVSPVTQRPQIDVVFAIDTTGSMAGLIQSAKEKVWSIAATMASGQPAPEIRVGLVAYRDRGDTYVTQTMDLTSDLDAMYLRLMAFEAGGGGDTQESVNAALNAAINQMSWSQDATTYRTVFLVGDAPGHTDYADEPQIAELIAAATNKGITLNAVQCGDMPATGQQFRLIANNGQGRFIHVAQGGSAVAVATPFDQRIAEVAAKVDETRMFYGAAPEREELQRKRESLSTALASVPAATRARRGVFNATESAAVGAAESDLVSEYLAGNAALDGIADAELPAALQALPAPARAKVVAKAAATRQQLETQLRDLAAQRDAFIAEELRDRTDLDDSLDHQILEAVSEQAAGKGLHFDATPTY